MDRSLETTRFDIRGDRRAVTPDVYSKAREMLSRARELGLPRLHFKSEDGGYSIDVIRPTAGPMIAVIDVSRATVFSPMVCPPIDSGLLWLSLEFDGCAHHGWYWDKSHGFHSLYPGPNHRLQNIYKEKTTIFDPNKIIKTVFIQPKLMKSPWFGTTDGDPCRIPLDNTPFVKSPAMYSGTMRAAMQLLAGMGVELDYEFMYARSQGCFIVGGVPWVVEIGSRGVLAAKMPICHQDDSHGRDPALRNSLFPFHPSPYSNPFRDKPSKWKVLMSPKMLSDQLRFGNSNTYYGPFASMFGWAFSYTTPEASIVLKCFDPNHPTQPWISTILARLTFTTSPNSEFIAGVVFSKSPAIYFNQALGNFKVPAFSLPEAPWGEYLASVGPIPSDFHYPPPNGDAYIHCYYSQSGGLQVVRHHIGSSIYNATWSEPVPGVLSFAPTSSNYSVWSNVPVAKQSFGARTDYVTQTQFYVSDKIGSGSSTHGTTGSFDLTCGAVDTVIVHPGGPTCTFGCGWIQTTGSCMGKVDFDADHIAVENRVAISSATVLWGDREHCVIANAIENSKTRKVHYHWDVPCHVFVIDTHENPDGSGYWLGGCYRNSPAQPLYCTSGAGYWGAIWGSTDVSSNGGLACNSSSIIPPSAGQNVAVTGGFDGPGILAVTADPTTDSRQQTITVYCSGKTGTTRVFDRTVITHPGEDIDPANPPYTDEDRSWDSYSSMACLPNEIGYPPCTFAFAEFGTTYCNTIGEGRYIPKHLFAMSVPYYPCPADRFSSMFLANPPATFDNIIYVGHIP